MATGTLEESAKFAAKLIKENPDISMAELKKAAKPHGIRIYPLAIGKAKVSLGMGRKKAAAKRGPGRPKGAKTRKRGPGRPRKATTPAAALSQIASQMRELERENAALRKALAKVADAVSGF